MVLELLILLMLGVTWMYCIIRPNVVHSNIVDIVITIVYFILFVVVVLIGRG